MMLSIFRPEKKEALNVSKSGNIGMIFLSMVTYPDEIFREDDFGIPSVNPSKQEQIAQLKQGLDLFSQRKINRTFNKLR
jgi:hypothetical protein